MSLFSCPSGRRVSSTVICAERLALSPSALFRINSAEVESKHHAKVEEKKPNLSFVKR